MTKDQESGGAPLEQLPDEALCRLIRVQDRPAEEVLAARYHRVVRSCARPYFLAGGDSEDLMQEGMFGLIKAMREYDPDRDASFRTFAETCIRHRLYSVVKAAAAGKHAPLNQSVPLNPSLFEANVSFAQPGPEDLLIDREKAVSLLENVRKQPSAGPPSRWTTPCSASGARWLGNFHQAISASAERNIFFSKRG